MIVVDASAVADLLLDPGGRGSWIGDRFASSSSLHAPHLLDFEVASVLRRHLLARELSRERAEDAFTDFRALRVRRYPGRVLLERIWSLRHNLTIYDASYVALAEALDAPLVTSDRRLVGVPGHQATVEGPA